MSRFDMASGAGRRDFLKGAAWMGAAAVAATPIRLFGAAASPRFTASR